jgi:hypothetical protein
VCENRAQLISGFLKCAPPAAVGGDSARGALLHATLWSRGSEGLSQPVINVTQVPRLRSKSGAGHSRVLVRVSSRLAYWAGEKTQRRQRERGRDRDGRRSAERRQGERSGAGRQELYVSLQSSAVHPPQERVRARSTRRRVPERRRGVRVRDALSIVERCDCRDGDAAGGSQCSRTGRSADTRDALGVGWPSISSFLAAEDWAGAASDKLPHARLTTALGRWAASEKRRTHRARA